MKKSRPYLLQGAKRIAQPLGFGLLLLYFVFENQTWALIPYWTGILLAISSAVFEVVQFRTTDYTKRTQVEWVFYLGILVKLFLIFAITLRVYNVNYSIFILLGGIATSLIWFALSQLIRPDHPHSEDFLDMD